jgi:hypothetical protein
LRNEKHDRNLSLCDNVKSWRELNPARTRAFARVTIG